MPLRTPLLLAALLGLLVVRGAASSPAVVVRLAPVEDVSLPFQCDWGYDWDERCFRDDSDRLPIGGDADKVWRAALRFSLDALPPGAGVQEALLTLSHDGVCVGPRGADIACEPRALTVEAHAILDPDWEHEREVAYDPTPIARASLPNAGTAGRLVFDVSDLVAAWAAGEAPAAGILLRLPHLEERFGRGGPKPPSSSFPLAAHRPRLDVAYVAPQPDPPLG
jgi:hypothetical protein